MKNYELVVIPALLLVTLISIEALHTHAHNKVKDGVDVHGWCKQAGFNTQ